MIREADDLPDLEDFTNEMEKIRPKKNESQAYIGDYTEPINESIAPPQKQSPAIKNKDQFAGIKKGFFDNNNKPSKREKELETLRPTDNKKNPLQIDEVQQNMNSQPNNLGSFLTTNKSQWLNEELLSKIATNEKLQKLFSNPEYMQAIQSMQAKPKETMAKYANNPEFMQLFQEFARVMGGHFEDLDPKPPSKEKSHEEIIQDTIQNDPEVRALLQDEKVVAFIEYLQKTRMADFNEILRKDPELGKKIQVLIKKGILNVQQ